MKIKETIYTALSPRQRVAATVAARARKDDAEIQRLREACPRGPDAAFWDTFHDLLEVSTRIECLLRGLAIDYLSIPHSGRETEQHEGIIRFFASIREAWRRHARDLEIDLRHLHAATGPHHDFVEALARHAEGKHDEATVEEFLGVIRAHVA
jgi:hypothetical protein